MKLRLAGHKKYKEAVQENMLLNELISGTGVMSFYRMETAEQKESIDFLTHQIKHSNAVQILGSTGFNTFTQPESFLHDTILNFEGSMQILLINPGIKTIDNFTNIPNDAEWEQFKGLLETNPRGEIERRSRDLGMNADEYRKEIFDSIIFLKQLKDKGRFVELRLHQGPLIWKMIISGDYLWLQHYPLGIHVNDAPVYGILKTNPDTTMINGFDVLFNRIWHSPYTIPFHL